MAKFRKKPVVIEAVQFRGSNHEDIANFASPQAVEVGSNFMLIIPTLEGPMTANAGDWIIKGVKGEVYACKPDIFAMTYEPAE